MRSLHTLLAGIIKEAREETLYQISLGVKPNGVSGPAPALPIGQQRQVMFLPGWRELVGISTH